MSILYADVPVWLRIGDAPASKTNACWEKASGKKRKRSFPWTYKMLGAAAAAHEDGNTWQQIADQLEIITGRSIGDNAVANRVLRFIEEKE